MIARKIENADSLSIGQGSPHRGISSLGCRTPIDIEMLLHWALSPAQGLSAAATFLDLSLDDTGRGAPLPAMASHLSRSSVQPDALTVKLAVDRLDRDLASLVLMHAQGMSRPDWHPNGAVRRLEPVWEGYGERRRIVIERHNCRPHFCPIKMLDTTELVAFGRRCWEAWRHALTSLAASLSGNRLRLWVPTGPAVAPAPWQNPESIARALAKLPY